MSIVLKNYGQLEETVPSTPPAAPVVKEKEAVKGEADNDLVPRDILSPAGANSQIERDKYVVDWDGPDDPQKPTNWSSRKKWKNLLIVNTITLITQVVPIATLAIV
jgi:hypothetical protein